MSDKNEGYENFLLDVILVVLLLFFSAASYYVLLDSFNNNLSYFLLIPIISIVILTIYYLKLSNKLNRFKKLIISDLIGFMLYLTCILLITFSLLEPLSFWWYYLTVLNFLYHFYYLLLFPLFGFILQSLGYLKKNRSFKNKRVLMVLLFLSIIITLFIVIYFLLNSSIPILRSFYGSIPDFD